MGIFFHLSYSMHIDHQTPRCQLKMLVRPLKGDTQKNHKRTRELPSLLCLLITHTHALCAHTTAAHQHTLTDSVSLVRPVLVNEIDPGNHFYHGTLIMIY